MLCLLCQVRHIAFLFVKQKTWCFFSSKNKETFVFSSAFIKGWEWEERCMLKDTSFSSVNMRWMFQAILNYLAFQWCFLPPPFLTFNFLAPSTLYCFYLKLHLVATWEQLTRLLYPPRFKLMENSERCLFRILLRLNGWCAHTVTDQ